MIEKAKEMYSGALRLKGEPPDPSPELRRELLKTSEVFEHLGPTDGRDLHFRKAHTIPTRPYSCMLFSYNQRS
jgi:hypothetical protein